MSFSNTSFGILVRENARMTKDKVLKIAFDKSVLNQMADLNVEQLNEGIYADGSDTPDYAPFTIELKKAKGQTWEYMTFKDTGQFHSSIMYGYGKGLQVFANDRYNLLEIYSPFILGLTGNSIEDIKDEVIENIQGIFLPK